MKSCDTFKGHIAFIGFRDLTIKEHFLNKNKVQLKIVKNKKQYSDLNLINKKENLFFCKSNELMNKYFISVFNWLQECEKIFGFDIHGYKYKRMYAFLAERYFSYWFTKYAKPLEWPIFFFVTNKKMIQIKRK